jgi:Abortive infection bacteriophage resistance protein
MGNNTQNLTPKPFKEIYDQVAILESRGICITDKDAAAHFLITHNYYSMINDYGKFFTSSSDVYVSNVTLHDIEHVFIFDKKLKSILFTLA